MGQLRLPFLKRVCMLDLVYSVFQASNLFPGNGRSSSFFLVWLVAVAVDPLSGSMVIYNLAQEHRLIFCYQDRYNRFDA
jgi:hypothetical protein